MDARAPSFLGVKLSRSGENDDCSMVVVAAVTSSSCIARQACGSCGAARAAWRIPFAVHLK